MTVKGGTEIYGHASNRSPGTDNLRYPPRRPKFARVIHCLQNSLDSFGALKSNSVGKFRTADTAVPVPIFRAHDRAQGNVVCTNARWRSAGGCLSYHQGARRWLTYSLSARARVHQFQLASGLSGFCSQAFLASLFQCAAQPAVKCTSGSPMMHG